MIPLSQHRFLHLSKQVQTDYKEVLRLAWFLTIPCASHGSPFTFFFSCLFITELPKLQEEQTHRIHSLLNMNCHISDSNRTFAISTFVTGGGVVLLIHTVLYLVKLLEIGYFFKIVCRWFAADYIKITLSCSNIDISQSYRQITVSKIFVSHHTLL